MWVPTGWWLLLLVGVATAAPHKPTQHSRKTRNPQYYIEQMNRRLATSRRSPYDSWATGNANYQNTYPGAYNDMQQRASKPLNVGYKPLDGQSDYNYYQSTSQRNKPRGRNDRKSHRGVYTATPGGGRAKSRGSKSKGKKKSKTQRLKKWWEEVNKGDARHNLSYYENY